LTQWISLAQRAGHAAALRDIAMADSEPLLFARSITDQK
jgi:hypothetical protein